MIARMILGCRSMIFRVASMGRPLYCSSSAFFHIIMVRRLFRFFSRRSKSSCASWKVSANSVSSGIQSWLLGGYHLLHGPRASFRSQDRSESPYSSYEWRASLCGIWTHCPWSKALTHFLCTKVQLLRQKPVLPAKMTLFIYNGIF